MNKKYILLSVIVVVIIIAAIAYFNKDIIKEQAFKPSDTALPEVPLTENLEEVVTQGLGIPWEIAFLPDRSMLVTERPGVLKHITSGTVINIDDVVARGEGGLLGLAVHPDFASNNYIYLYSTTAGTNGLQNHVVRYKFQDNKLLEPKTILEGIIGNNNHDGGRMAFGPDKMLYITTGDAQVENRSQDKNSLNGKILRVKDDGSVPPDNPFNNAVYSYGHRNVQGIAWDDQGNLWATEHGPSGITSGEDELNKIERGGNYGWPVITGDETQTGMINPVIHSTKKETWAPSGLAFYKGHLIFAGLRGQSLYSVAVSNGKTTGNLTSSLREKYGRRSA